MTFLGNISLIFVQTDKFFVVNKLRVGSYTCSEITFVFHMQCHVLYRIDCHLELWVLSVCPSLCFVQQAQVVMQQQVVASPLVLPHANSNAKYENKLLIFLVDAV